MSEHGGDIYNNIVETDYSVNISPFGIPDSVREAVGKSFLQLSAYPDEEYIKLRGAIAELEECDTDNVVCGNGATELIYAFIRAIATILRRNGISPQIGLLTPCFSEYEKAAVQAEIEDINYVYLKEDQGFLPDKADIDLLLDKSNIIIIGNPNNPTGRLLDPKWLRELLFKASKLGSFVIIDESFIALSDRGQEYKATDLKPDVVINSFTKSMAIPGIRIGYALTDNSVIMNEVKKILPQWNVSIPAVYAGLAACECIKHLNSNVFSIEDERIYLSDELIGLGFRVYPSEANYILFRNDAKTSNGGESEDKGNSLYEELLKRKILIRKCNNYKGLDESYYRISVRKHSENVKLIGHIKEIMGLEMACDLPKDNKSAIIHVLPADIEKTSFSILTGELEDKGIILSGDREAVIKRCIHTTADFEYAYTLMFSDNAVEIMKNLIREGAHIVTDTNMALSGINKIELAKYNSEVHCFMADADIAKRAKENGTTRATASMEYAAGLGRKLIFVVGNAPTALITLCEMIDGGRYIPDFVIGVPVGFVNVVAAKEMIMERNIPYIVNKGRKGGSNVAAAIVNAVLYQMREEDGQ